MDMKPNFVKNVGGIFKIPIGFRFHPTDEELVVHYLKSKVHSLPFPAAVIPQLDDVFHSNPLDLPGDSKEKRYFFSKRYRNCANKCNRICTVSGSGRWKCVGKEKQIMASSGRNQTAAMRIGVRKTLVFCQAGKQQTRGLRRTHWIMHEFRLATTPNAHQKVMTAMEEYWVVCCIYRKKAKAKNGNITRKKVGKITPSIIDIAMEDCNDSGTPPPRPSSSCSSEISSDHEEEINQCLHP